MADALHQLTLAKICAHLQKKHYSAEELTQAYLAQAEEKKALNAYITMTPETALAQAKQADAKFAKGEAGMLEGVPLAIKDLFCTQGVRTTAASRMLEHFVPHYSSTVVARLERQGAVMLGKANLDEFAMGSSNEHSYFGPVLNPWQQEGSDAKLVPGGSSGGSAAAVAAHLCAGALGTDTGGSIRQPAAFCGITGLKPTYGRCSRFGVIAFASSLDQPGPMAKTVEDCALLLQAMAGHDPKDATSSDAPMPSWHTALTPDVRGKRIGIPQEYQIDGMPSEIKALWEQGAAWLKEAGAEIVEVSLPHTSAALPAYYVLAPAEASANLARYDGIRFGHRAEGPFESLDALYAKTRAEGFGPEVRRRIFIGTYVLSAGYYDAYYRKAQQVRRRITQDFAQAFEQVDALLTPTTPGPAFALGKEQDPLHMYMNDVFTVPASLAGLPAISVPAGLSQEKLPLGLQVIGKALDEQTVLDVGLALEQAAQFRGE